MWADVSRRHAVGRRTSWAGRRGTLDAVTGVGARRTGRGLGLLLAGSAVLLAGCAAGPTSATPAPAATAAAPTTPAATAGTTTAPTAAGLAPTAPAYAGFAWRPRPATAAELGSSWRRGCPVPPADLRIVRLTYWTFRGTVAEGDLVLHRSVVARTRPVFAAMFRQRFPLRSVRPVTAFGSSDDRSMAADNTSAFNCRRAVAAGPPTWSRHAYGTAIDVNPVENPYLFRGEVLPPNGSRHVDRSRPAPGRIRAGDAVHRAFRAAGYRWGTFSNPDYQHFDR
jgi:D-alanyl-D-alanine carboxypeptidase-like protein